MWPDLRRTTLLRARRAAVRGRGAASTRSQGKGSEVAKDKVTAVSLAARKGKGPSIAIATAYDATMARLLDAGGVDALMVGDSLGMVVQGGEHTLAVTLEEVIYHSRAVARVRPRAHVVADLPFLSYQLSPEQALHSAGRLVKEGDCESVKLEGGVSRAEAVRRIVDAGIPVMGHVGLTPQSVHQMGGFRVQGRTAEAAQRIFEDARALDEAGVYALVLEGIPSDLAQRITAAVRAPTIGIGAGPHTDGQVLVCYDFLGMFREFTPKFVKRFAEVGNSIVEATERFVDEVRSGAFPAPEHEFSRSAGPSGAGSAAVGAYGPSEAPGGRESSSAVEPPAPKGTAS